MSRKISWNICRAMATSAIWKITWRPWLTTFAPILISFSFRLVSDQSLIGSGVASVRGSCRLVGEHMKLKPHRVCGERSARQSRPLDRAFALLDPLLARPALVVESNDALGRVAHVRHDEADAGIKFSGMPLDLGDHPARLGPGCGLIAEIGMESPDFIGRSSDRTLKQVANPTLQDLVGRQPDRMMI